MGCEKGETGLSLARRHGSRWLLYAKAGEIKDSGAGEGGLGFSRFEPSLGRSSHVWLHRNGLAVTFRISAPISRSLGFVGCRYSVVICGRGGSI